MAEDKSEKLSEILEQLRKEVTKISPLVRMPGEALMTLHRDVIHEIRKFAAGGYFRVIVEHKKPYHPYENLANACRNAIASIIRCQQRDIHCTIRRCKGEKGQVKEAWKVWTFAWSTVNPARPVDFGPDCFRKIGENSIFSALVGCKDRKTDWRPFTYPCFACNNLPDFDSYDESDEDWDIWYRSVLAFPLRYQTTEKGEDNPLYRVLGFLTFDSLNTNIFRDIPSIFHYIGEPADYERKLMESDLFHAGGLIADVIAMALMLERRLRIVRETKGVG